MIALASSTSAFDQPGTLGFLVVFGMGIVLFFVFRSMARHLRKVNNAARQDASAVPPPGPGLPGSPPPDPGLAASSPPDPRAKR